MPPSPTYDCGHERRPGTTVCLQCRQQAISWSARRQRRILGTGAAMVGIVGILAAVMMMRREALTGEIPVETLVPQSARETPAGGLAAAEAARGTAAPAPAALLPPRITEGRTELGEGMFAIRTGDTVMVSFDTPDLRTRRRDKFQRTLRTTLRQVYGPQIDTVLASQPDDLLAGRDLLGEVTTAGLRLPLPGGAGVLAVWPRTRPGQDGPLVISYVAVPAR